MDISNSIFFKPDTINGVVEYFDDNAKNLRRAFLKAPVKFGPVTSRYNLKRRIAYYGNKVRPHRGTDFAAPTGTPIMATADGRVVKSSYTRGNGYYVKIQHNDTYSTQYLHMQKKGRIKQGKYVKQGDVIGRIGMTGNTSGPHVCYRFWKNGKQVDPFKQKLPPGKPVPKKLKYNFDEAISIIQSKNISLIITDIWMNNNTKAGLEILKWSKEYNSLIPVIMMSGHGNIETAMIAAKTGAFDFIEKPFKSERLLLLVEKALNDRNLKIKISHITPTFLISRNKKCLAFPVTVHLKYLNIKGLE